MIFLILTCICRPPVSHTGEPHALLENTSFDPSFSTITHPHLLWENYRGKKPCDDDHFFAASLSRLEWEEDDVYCQSTPHYAFAPEIVALFPDLPATFARRSLPIPAPPSADTLLNIPHTPVGGMAATAPLAVTVGEPTNAASPQPPSLSLATGSSVPLSLVSTGPPTLSSSVTPLLVSHRSSFNKAASQVCVCVCVCLCLSVSLSVSFAV